MICDCYTAKREQLDDRVTTKRLGGVEPEINLEEDSLCIPPPGHEKSQRRHHPKSATRVSVIPRKGHLGMDLTNNCLDDFESLSERECHFELASYH